MKAKLGRMFYCRLNLEIENICIGKRALLIDYVIWGVEQQGSHCNRVVWGNKHNINASLCVSKNNGLPAFCILQE